MTRVLQMMAGSAMGGAEGFFMRLVPALHRAGLDQKAVIRTHRMRAEILTESGVPFTEMRFGGRLDFATGWKLKQVIRDYQPDLVLGWMSRAARFVPKGYHVNVARLGGYYDLKYYRTCKHLIGNTQDICDYLIREGWPKDNVWHLPNFVDNTRMPPQDRAALDTPEDAPLLLGLGRLHENKAFDLGLEVLAEVKDAYYWIAGEGPKRDELIALAERLGVTDRVRFLGWRDDVPALFGAADIFLCTSRHEPLGNMVIEAWAQGVPVVAANSQGPGQNIRHGVNGLLSPVDRAAPMAANIRNLIDHPAARVELATGGAESYQDKFTEAKVVQDYLDFFEKVTG
ncbi:glycosyltransferase [Aestuariispira insulae]|uniref:Glycosyltransferase involved in cell wall biosynthesis n=1 Tax=Aestuariispira insulae TaxID=1461337 RepID=A0A3D9HRW0_9PROT|nr:glycosyltransferase [Aestuariispira insulae]RED52253.1 glycosyltransferase involved in cell wall biosynthesis [Aestuariispira insulae]